MEHVIILGASRGLGAELVQHACEKGAQVFGFARKTESLALLRERFANFAFAKADFSTVSGQDEVLRHLLASDFSRLFIVAGGGPFGNYEERAFKDHDWAWEVTFRFPARVLHSLLLAKKPRPVVVVGSAVAEAHPDPMAASYCAAKHALRGLVLSLRAEKPNWDLRLFSPGYMDTELLPKNAAVRQRGVYQPAQVAREMWSWALAADPSGQRVYPKHPS